jgi:hypothetical protein
MRNYIGVSALDGGFQGFAEPVPLLAGGGGVVVEVPDVVLLQKRGGALLSACVLFSRLPAIINHHRALSFSFLLLSSCRVSEPHAEI